ncbi:MAG: DUF4397 domain-containing protein [Lachnospiraceae bacterium]|nr:DUF4397 domain-containing protein [Lachnospiraceae bacterium]
MAENDSYQTPSASSDSFPANAANDTAEPAGWHSPTQGGMTTPIAPEGGIPSYPGTMTENSNTAAPITPEGNMPASPQAMMDANNAAGWNAARNNNMEYESDDAAPPEGRHMVYPGNVTWGCATCDSSTPSVPGFPGLPVIPSMPSSPSVPSTPSMPSIPSMPSFPSFPGNPVMPSAAYGQVRFINASTNTFPVTFRIDGIPYSSNSQFGNVSYYQPVSDGFHTVSVNRTTGMQALLLQQTFPFTANQKVTMVLVDAREGGLEMIQVADTGCSNLPAGYGCYRVVNASYSGSSFDVRMYNGDTIFRNLRFTQISSYKRALAGTYTFYLTNANFSGVIRELPIIIIGAITGTSPLSRPLTSDNVTIRAGQNTTTYIIGNVWSSYSLRMLTVND